MGGDFIGKQIYDYTQAEAEYITTNISYACLAEKHKIPMTSLAKYAKDNQWVAKRKQYCENIVTEIADSVGEGKIDKLKKLISASDMAADVIEKTLSDAQQFQRYVVTEKDGIGETTQEYIFEKIDTKALRDVVASIKDLTTVMRNLNDLPTSAEREARAIAKERFELEKKKIENENNHEDTITVAFEGDADI